VLRQFAFLAEGSFKDVVAAKEADFRVVNLDTFHEQPKVAFRVATSAQCSCFRIASRNASS